MISKYLQEYLKFLHQTRMGKKKMKKMTALFAAGIGALVLTGCGTHEVMGERYYKNSDGSETNVPAARQGAPAEQPAQPAIIETPAPAPAPAKQFRGYEPMQQLDSDKIAGLDEKNTKSVRKSSGKVAAKGKSKIYKVRRGDNPSRIAARHRISVAALMQANNLDEAGAKRLRIGQKLVIPAPGTKAVYKGKKAAPAKKAKKNQAAPASSKALNADGTYSVKRGDSPERIARKFKVKVVDLLKANNLDEASSRRLQIGQKLVIPGSPAVVTPKKDDTQSVTTPTTTPGPNPPVAPTGDDDPFKGIDGQTPAATPAAGTNTPAETESDTGDIISQAVLEDISLADFAKKHNTTVEELKKINKRPLPDMLKQNELIDIPLR